MTEQDESSNLPSTIIFESESLFGPILEEFEPQEGLTLYDIVMSNIDEEVFNRLKKQKKMSVAGMNFFDGGVFDKMSVAGRGSSSDDVITKELRTAGSAKFAGMLAVAESAKIAGSFSVNGDAFFRGKLKIAGSGTFHKNMVGSGKSTIAGRLTVNKYILADGDISTEGNLSAQGIRSLAKIHLGGKLWIGEDLIGREILLENMSGVVQGNLYAEKIIDRSNGSEDIDEERDLKTVGGLFQFLVNTIKDIFSGNRNKGLMVEGDVIADQMELNNIRVQGNVYGNDVVIGEDTTVLGKIYYRETISLPKGREDEFLVVEGLPDKLDIDEYENVEQNDSGKLEYKLEKNEL